MRVVIDASVDPRLVEAFPDHQVQTLFDLGWQRLKDHVLITADRGFEHDLKSLSFGIVIVHVARNKITFYRPLVPQLVNAVATIGASDVIHVYGFRSHGSLPHVSAGGSDTSAFASVS
jgi:hypothetical protein